MKKPTLELKATIAVRDGVTLSELATAVGELQAKLRTLGEGDVQVKMPRGAFGA